MALPKGNMLFNMDSAIKRKPGTQEPMVLINTLGKTLVLKGPTRVKDSNEAEVFAIRKA